METNRMTLAQIEKQIANITLPLKNIMDQNQNLVDCMMLIHGRILSHARQAEFSEVSYLLMTLKILSSWAESIYNPLHRRTP